jgi:uncharacterized protein (TIGR03086 family)
MADTISSMHRAQDGFTRALEAVGDGQWSSPTPCTDWDVRALVNHVAGELLWAPPLVAGKTIDEVGDQFDGDVLGDDPVAVWRTGVTGARTAFEEGGALERTVHLSFGDFTGDNYAWQLISDIVVHTWDLARAVGADDSLPEDLAADVAAFFGPMLESFGPNPYFAAAVDVPADASAQDKLLALTGRSR